MGIFFRFLTGTIIGGLLGALIGLLLAPRSGKETRGLIKEEFDNRYQGSKLQSTVQDAQQKVQQSVTQTGEHVQKVALDTAENLKHKAQQVGAELEQTGKRYLETFSGKSSDTPQNN